MSKLIIEEPPLQVLPSLAIAIGLNEAIVLQQLHYLLRDPRFGKRIAEKQWIFNTVEQWRASYFPFWNERTIRRIFDRLSELRLIETCQPEGRISRRKYFRINEAVLTETADAAKLSSSMRTNCPDGKRTNCPLPITKTSSETSFSETTGLKKTKVTSAVAEAYFVSENELGPEERIMAKVSRVREELLWVEAPDARTHTDGIHKSDDIPRMLPMEGSLYLHPVFRKLWKAKFIERSLACYQVKGIAQRRKLTEEWVEEEQIVRKKLERGPIIVCLDTSGSMHGIPETVAKAITLEAMRLAHAEGRDCLLYAFSGYGDVAEHDLDLSPAGIESLCEFLCMSFHGGTDISGPIRAATRKLEGAKWKRADIIMVSDGEFDVPGETQHAIEEAKKKHGLRVHGLLVSNGYHSSYGLSSMRSLCDPVHVFRDWTEVKGL